MTTKNMWGDIPEVDSVRTPASMLREQAQILSKRTKGLLNGHVSRNIEDITGKFLYTLAVRAPALDNYRYIVLEITHGLELYPVDLRYIDGLTVESKTEEEFLRNVEKKLQSEDVRKAITSLLSQSKGDQVEFD